MDVDDAQIGAATAQAHSVQAHLLHSGAAGVVVSMVQLSQRAASAGAAFGCSLPALGTIGSAQGTAQRLAIKMLPTGHQHAIRRALDCHIA